MIAARALDGGDLKPGSIYSDGKRLLVACGENTSLQIDELQLAGKKRMEAAAFLNGYKLEANERLGEQL